MSEHSAEMGNRKHDAPLYWSFSKLVPLEWLAASQYLLKDSLYRSCVALLPGMGVFLACSDLDEYKLLIYLTVKKTEKNLRI